MPEITTQVSSTIKGLTREFELIAHNLANVSTPGFKRRFNDFSANLTAQEGITQTSEDEGAALLTAVDFSQGNFVETGRRMDMALCGKGFFVIETPDGPLYTRNGTFRLDENNRVVDMIGRTIAGQSGPITVPQSVGLEQLSVTEDGSIIGAGIPLGKFKLVDFQDNESTLIPAGLSCFQAPMNIEPEDAEKVIVKQGFQEGSNVQVTEELVDMIMVSRLYEANMAFVSKSGETSKQLLDVAMS